MTTLRGADSRRVHAAYRAGDPLPGGRGFAGELRGLGLVRDVLGREPLFVDDGAWSDDPRGLDDPSPFPAGHAGRAGGATERVWALPDPTPADPGAALDAVRRALDAALADAEADAVALSGGVDSALVAAALDRPCYVVGFEGCHDIAAAREAAAALGRSLTVVTLDHDDLRRSVRQVVTVTGRTSAMDAAVGATFAAVGEAAAADGHDSLALGQGADELFGGYAKVARLDDRVAADSVPGAVRETIHTLPDGLARDVPLLRAVGVEPVVPYLDDRVVRAALRLPAALLVDRERDERKVALRRVARDALPADLASAPKKAAQYGSYVSRELDRLARQAGYKRRVDDHVRRYVESL
ncbi:MAG: asparagine synthase C-terminal domain-containing protein [Haloferacaceae archaeon]